MGTTGQEASDPMLFQGRRVHRLRAIHGISQTKLAKMVGTTPSQVSVIESNKSRPSLKTAIALARALDTSLDYLTGEIDNATPYSGLLTDPGLWYEYHLGPDREWGTTDDDKWNDYVAITEVDTAAGAGAVVHDERITGRMKFPARWLRREGLEAQHCRIIRVIGESMEPTLPDGCSILVNHEVTEPEDGKIFVIRAGDELIVKRTLQLKSGRWVVASDNPDTKTWPTRPWPTDAVVIGQVRWIWYTLP